jgi:hypothetical protein
MPIVPISETLKPAARTGREGKYTLQVISYRSS